MSGDLTTDQRPWGRAEGNLWHRYSDGPVIPVCGREVRPPTEHWTRWGSPPAENACFRCLVVRR